MKNPLIAHIKDELEKNILDRPVLIWYDSEGSFIDIVNELSETHYNLIVYDGSYLKIRYRIEKEDPYLDKKWVIYIPEDGRSQSWLHDYEYFGTIIRMNLEQLLTSRLGLVSNTNVKKLLSGKRGRLLFQSWNKVMGEKIIVEEEGIRMALAKLLFESGSDLNMHKVVLEYLSYPEKYDKLIQDYDLHEIFVNLINLKLGLHLDPFSPLPKEQLASAALLTELHVHAGHALSEKQYVDMLPLNSRRNDWLNIIEDWQNNSKYRSSFFKWSSALEKKYDIPEKIKNVDHIENISSFRCIDDILMDRLCQRIETTLDSINLNEVLDIIKIRSKLIWATSGFFTKWKTIEVSLNLREKCNQLRKTLDDHPQSLDQLLEQYCDEDGWWKLDFAFLELFGLKEEDEKIRSLFITPASQAYYDWLKFVNKIFSDKVSRLSSWDIKKFISQQNFWQQIVGFSDERCAVLLIDAMRLDLCKRLESKLKTGGCIVELHNMISALPSVTEVCMTSLLPNVRNHLRIQAETNRFDVFANERKISGRQDREKWLLSTLGDDVKILTLDDLRKKSDEEVNKEIKDFKRIIAMDTEIDKAGTSLSNMNVEIFAQLIDSLKEAILRLHRAGIKRIIVATDHGFLLFPPGYHKDRIPISEPNVYRNRRFILTKEPSIDYFIKFSMESLGFLGKGYFLFPPTIMTIGIQGEHNNYLHGGVSLQENCIAILVSEIKEAKEKINLEVSHPSVITGKIFYLKISSTPSKKKEEPRNIYIRVKNNHKKLFESEEFVLDMNSEVRKKIVLEDIVDQIDINIIDTDLDQIIYSTSVQVFMEGYEGSL